MISAGIGTSDDIGYEELQANFEQRWQYDKTRKEVGVGAHVEIFDTTLRDGDQGEGTAFEMTDDNPEKAAIACALAAWGVRAMEIGFAASRADNGMDEVIRILMQNFGGENQKPLPTIVSLARSTAYDIDESAKVLEALPQDKRRIHVFTSGSDKHVLSKFGTRIEHYQAQHQIDTIEEAARQYILEETQKWVSYAKSKGCEVEHSAEDALRSDPEFLLQVVTTAIRAGASVINIPDTVGAADREKTQALLRWLIENTNSLRDEGFEFRFSFHGHNDFDNGVENAEAAVIAGAKQIETTVGGIGERFGNTNILSFLARNTGRGLHVQTKLAPELSHKVACLVDAILGNHRMAQPVRDPVAHGAGIHANGAQKGREKFGVDIYSPHTVDFGVPENRVRFNPRGGATNMIRVLEEVKKLNHGVESVCDTIISGLSQRPKPTPESEGFLTRCAQEAVKMGWLEVHDIYKQILILSGVINPSTISIEFTSGAGIRVNIPVNGHDCIIEHDGTGTTGAIDAFIHGLNDFLEGEVDIDDYRQQSKLSARAHLHEAGYSFVGLEYNAEEHGSAARAVTRTRVRVGETLARGRDYDESASKSAIKSIITATLPQIVAKARQSLHS